MRFQLIVLVGILGLAACASGGPVGQKPGLTLVETVEMPAPGVADYRADAAPYLVGPLDTLMVDIIGYEPFRERSVQVDASGRISVPVAGEIEAAGYSPSQIENSIETALRNSYFRDPQVTVNLMDTKSKTVTVEGDVVQPGIYPMVRDMTLLRSLASAKGLNDTAKLDNVIVFRTVNGQEYAGLYSVTAIRNGNYPDPQLYADDLVVVSSSRARRLFKDFLQLAPLLSSPLIVALQNN